MQIAVLEENGRAAKINDETGDTSLQLFSQLCAYDVFVLSAGIK